MLLFGTASTQNLPNVYPQITEMNFLALFFAQYHPVAENREFNEKTLEMRLRTEWTNFDENLTNVSRFNHSIIQPKSFYDLRSFDVRKEQRKEAERIGVDAFIYFHYWLENHAVKATVTRLMLLDGEPNLPFAFCFANEGWPELIYGLKRHPLPQLYDMPENHAVWFAQYFAHKNYLHFEGHPVLYVYLINNMPEFYIQRINAYLAILGIPSIYLIGHLTPYGQYPYNYNMTSFQNASAEFAPHIPGAHSYNESLTWKTKSGQLGEGFPVARGILTAWDPTPRYGIICYVYLSPLETIGNKV